MNRIFKVGFRDLKGKNWKVDLKNYYDRLFGINWWSTFSDFKLYCCRFCRTYSNTLWFQSVFHLTVLNCKYNLILCCCWSMTIQEWIHLNNKSHFGRVVKFSILLQEFLRIVLRIVCYPLSLSSPQRSPHRYICSILFYAQFVREENGEWY